MHGLASPSLDAIGIEQGVDQSSTGHGYLEIYEGLLAEHGNAPRIAVVGATNPVSFANTLALFLPQATILLLDIRGQTDAHVPLANVQHLPVRDSTEIHAAMAGFGPVDILIEDGSNTRKQKRELLRNLLFHVRDGGHYVVEDMHAIHIERLAQGGGPNVLDDILAAWSLKLSNSKAEASQDERALATAIAEIRFMGKLAVITKAGNHAWNLRDAGMKTRAPYSRTLAHHPPEPFEARASVATNNDLLEKQWLKNSYTYPAVYLHEYANVLCAPGQVYYQGSIVLPDSFRHFTRAARGNRRLEQLSHHVSQAAPSAEASLTGAYFALDSELPGHFGHVTSEVISRLWGWDEAKKHHPELKALVSQSTPEGIAPWEYEILRGAGVASEDITIIDSPVQVELLIGATPMFSQPIGAHPAVKDIWDKVGSTLSARNSSSIEKVFIGRKPGASSRLCRNWQELEARFVANGFTVVYPEDLSFPDQVSLFHNARTIAGYGGSGMFSVMFAGGPKDVIVIGSESYNAVNEYVISSVLGGSITYFWCVPDIPQPAGKWREKAFMSDYEFDFKRDGALLDQVLS